MIQNELAEIAGVSRATISRVESGQTNLRLRNIRAIEEHFGESIDSLLGVDSQPLPPWYQAYQALNERDRELIDLVITSVIDGMNQRSQSK